MASYILDMGVGDCLADLIVASCAVRGEDEAKVDAAQRVLVEACDLLCALQTAAASSTHAHAHSHSHSPGSSSCLALPPGRRGETINALLRYGSESFAKGRAVQEALGRAVALLHRGDESVDRTALFAWSMEVLRPERPGQPDAHAAVGYACMVLCDVSFVEGMQAWFEGSEGFAHLDRALAVWGPVDAHIAAAACAAVRTYTYTDGGAVKAFAQGLMGRLARTVWAHIFRAGSSSSSSSHSRSLLIHACGAVANMLASGGAEAARAFLATGMDMGVALVTREVDDDGRRMGTRGGAGHKRLALTDKATATGRPPLPLPLPPFSVRFTWLDVLLSLIAAHYADAPVMEAACTALYNATATPGDRALVRVAGAYALLRSAKIAERYPAGSDTGTGTGRDAAVRRLLDELLRDADE